VEVLLQGVVGTAMVVMRLVVQLFQQLRPSKGDGQPIDLPHALAGVMVVVIALPLGFLAVQATRLSFMLFGDDLLMFVAIVIAPLMLLGAVFAACAFAAGVAIAIGLAARVRGAVIGAWVFAVLGAIESATCFDIELFFLGTLVAGATVIEVVLLLTLSRAPQRDERPTFTV
jgi:hypothetical protein